MKSNDFLNAAGPMPMPTSSIATCVHSPCDGTALFSREIELVAGSYSFDIEATDASDNMTTATHNFTPASGNLIGLEYDDDGNVIEKTTDPGGGNEEIITYGWDVLGRLLWVRGGDADTAGARRTRYHYNSLSQRNPAEAQTYTSGAWITDSAGRVSSSSMERRSFRNRMPRAAAPR